VLNLLLTLCLTSVAPQSGQATPFEEWLIAYRGEQHLEEFLRHELLKDAAESAGILPTAQDIDESLREQRDRRIENAYGGDLEAWSSGLLRLNLTEESWREEQRIPTLNALLVDRLVRRHREITEQDVIAAWEKSYGPGGRGMTVRWIQLVITPPTPPTGATREEVRALREASRAADKERADEIRRAWESGADFLELQASTGSGAEPRAPFSLDQLTWPDSLRRAVKELSEGEISAPEAARGAWNLIQLVSSTQTPLESVRGELNAMLLARAANSAETDELFSDLMRVSAPTISLEEHIGSGDPLDPERNIGQLRDQPLKLRDFVRWLTETHGRPHKGTFEQMKLIERLSIAAGDSFTAEEITSRRKLDLDAKLQLFHEGDKETWLRDLESRGRTLSGWQREASIRALHDLRAEALFFSQREVSDEEVSALWQERFGEDGVSRAVRVITLGLKRPEKIDQADLEEWLEGAMETLELKAKELRERVVEGGEDFGALARRHSSDSATRLEGGRIPGIFQLREQPAVIAREVKALEIGGVSEPVRLLTGFALFQLIEKKRTPFDDVRRELYSELMLQRPSAVELSSFVNQLFERSKR
jgi:hypothetical protein